MDFSSWEELAKLAPLATALIALGAAGIAWRAIHIQRDTAKRRAAIDFFLKMETEDGLIGAYDAFRALAPQIVAIASRPNLTEADPEYRTVRKWLNICELVAVGVNQGAFSDAVADAYWGYILPETFEDARILIMHIRTNPNLGGPSTFCDLEELCQKWIERDPERHGG